METSVAVLPTVLGHSLPRLVSDVFGLFFATIRGPALSDEL